MFKLLKLAVVLAALAAVWTLAPIGGRTMQARWSAARSPEAFATACWAELRRALDEGAPAKAGTTPRAQARGTDAPGRPSEQHTDRDRQAVDRIVAERLRK